MSRSLPVAAYVCAILVLVAANIGIYRSAFAPDVLAAQVLHVGKGTAILVRSPRGGTLLVDAGGDAGILRALGEALPMWQRDIDTLILTSSDGLSTGGLSAMEDRYRVRDTQRFGTAVPYGAAVSFGQARILVTAPHRTVISYGASVLAVSSTTPSGIYHLDGSGLEE